MGEDGESKTRACPQQINVGQIKEVEGEGGGRTICGSAASMTSEMQGDRLEDEEEEKLRRDLDSLKRNREKEKHEEETITRDLRNLR